MIDFHQVRVYLGMKRALEGEVPFSAFKMYAAICALSAWSWNDVAQDAGGMPVLATFKDIVEHTDQPLPDIDGKIIVHAEDVGGIRLLSYEWEGGIIHGASGALVEDAEPTLLRIEGDVMFFGPYRFRILGYLRPSDTYILRMLPEPIERIELR